MVFTMNQRSAKANFVHALLIFLRKMAYAILFIFVTELSEFLQASGKAERKSCFTAFFENCHLGVPLCMQRNLFLASIFGASEIRLIREIR